MAIACVGNRLTQNVGARSAFAKVALRKFVMKPTVSFAGKEVCNSLAAVATYSLKKKLGSSVLHSCVH